MCNKLAPQVNLLMTQPEAAAQDVHTAGTHSVLLGLYSLQQ